MSISDLGWIKSFNKQIVLRLNHQQEGSTKSQHDLCQSRIWAGAMFLIILIWTYLVDLIQTL